MRLGKLRLQHITRFTEPVEVDFAALGEGLVAIAGRNGAGKTTILEAPFAALYGEMPTRPGGLYGVAHGKDARLELEVDNGQPYRALVAVDAVRQTSEAFLYNGTGEPLTSGKLREYQAVIEQRFGSARLMLSAALSAQNKRGCFLDLSKAERKDLLSEILDTSGLQRIAEAARERAKATEATLERTRGEASGIERELETLTAAAESADLEGLRARHATLREQIAQAERDLEAARQRYTDAEAALARAGEQVKARERLAAQIDDVGRRLAAAHRQTEATAEERVTTRARAERDMDEAQDEAARLEEYRETAAELAGYKVQRAVADAAVQDCEAHRERLRDRSEQLRSELQPLAAAVERLEAAQCTASLLAQVPCTPLADIAGACPLLAGARAAERQIPEHEAAAARHADLEAQLSAVNAEVVEAEQGLISARSKLSAVDSTIRDLGPVAARLPLAEQAAARIEQISNDADAADRRLAERHDELVAEAVRLHDQHLALGAELAGAPEIRTADLQAAVEAARQAGAAIRQHRDTLTDQAGEMTNLIAQAEADQRRHEQLAARLAEIKAGEAATVAEVGEWRTLERAFGRDGIQALEIDAAGPELSALTNELLAECFGPRFEVAFVTQALKADGKGSKEVFDLVVTDHERGRREGSVESLSGGERTIVSEAISLSLAIYVGRHSGRRYETLWRDETAGQLDPDNAQRYVSMLRRARLMAGAHQVVFIAQQPEVWQQADAVLWVEDGRVEVRG